MKNVNKIGAFTKMCCTIGNLPTSYMMSMTYEEQLLWLCNYLEKTIIPALNGNAEAVEELQAQFNLLKTYVDNYFEDLDIQEEINNKLDDMAEKGELTDIIAQYLQLAGVLAYNTINDMKEATNLTEGSICRTLGDFIYNDNGGAFYKVRTITNDDVVDGFKIVALDVSDTLIAERIFNEDDYSINYRSYVDGVNGSDANDGKTPQTAWRTLDRFLQQANNGRTDIRCYIISDGTYTIERPIISNSVIHITANTNNVIIKRKGLLTFYDCHVNLENIDFIHENNTGENYIPYIEDGSLVAENCIIECPFTFYHSNVLINNSTINQLRLDGSTYYLSNITVDGKNKDAFGTPFRIQSGSSGEINTVTFNTLIEKNVNKLVYGSSSNIILYGTFTIEEQTDYNYGDVTCHYCSLNLSDTLYYSFIDNNYNVNGTKLQLPKIKIRDTDIILGTGVTLTRNDSYFDGESTNLNLTLVLSSITGGQNVDILTIPSRLAGSGSLAVIGQSNRFIPLYMWLTTGGILRCQYQSNSSNEGLRIVSSFIR